MLESAQKASRNVRAGKAAGGASVGGLGRAANAARESRCIALGRLIAGRDSRAELVDGHLASKCGNAPVRSPAVARRVIKSTGFYQGRQSPFGLGHFIACLGAGFSIAPERRMPYGAPMHFSLPLAGGQRRSIPLSPSLALLAAGPPSGLRHRLYKLLHPGAVKRVHEALGNHT